VLGDGSCRTGSPCGGARQTAQQAHQDAPTVSSPLDVPMLAVAAGSLASSTR
jgi:hypothetical protein